MAKSLLNEFFEKFLCLECKRSTNLLGVERKLSWGTLFKGSMAKAQENAVIFEIFKINFSYSREISLFTKCPEGFANTQLADLFQLDWMHIKNEEDLMAQAQNLKPGIEGQSCLLDSANSRYGS